MSSPTLLWLFKRFFGTPRLMAELEDARASVEVADLVYGVRQEAGLTQRDLAQRIGTGASVICRLERDEYRGHGLAMLRRIAWTVGRRVEIRIVPREPREAQA